MTDSMVREALEPFAKVARYMFVSGHCGGASPKDFPLKWNVHLDIGPSNFSPQQGAPLLTVADFQRASEALAALASEPGESEKFPPGPMSRLKSAIDGRLNDCLCEMKPDYDDSITGFNEAWDIVRKTFSDYEALSRQQPAGASTELDERQIPTYGAISWEQLGRDVMEATIGQRRDFNFAPEFYPGHQSPGINFNSLARIVDKYRRASTPQPANRNAMRDERSGTLPTQADSEEHRRREQMARAVSYAMLGVEDRWRDWLPQADMFIADLTRQVGLCIDAHGNHDVQGDALKPSPSPQTEG